MSATRWQLRSFELLTVIILPEPPRAVALEPVCKLTTGIRDVLLPIIPHPYTVRPRDWLIRHKHKHQHIHVLGLSSLFFGITQIQAFLKRNLFFHNLFWQRGKTHLPLMSALYIKGRHAAHLTSVAGQTFKCHMQVRFVVVFLPEHGLLNRFVHTFQLSLGTATDISDWLLILPGNEKRFS